MKHLALITLGIITTALVIYNKKLQFIPNKLPKNLKKYSVATIKKHNTKDDAWIILDGYVYDVTKWIPDHPGGLAIMKGVGSGEDWLDNFSKIDSHLKNNAKIRGLLTKYLIGKLE